MKFIDAGGDIWEVDAEGLVRVVRIDGREVGYAEACEREVAEASWGPLRELDEDTLVSETSLPTISDVMDRSAVFQSAHALVAGLKWEESESPSVYDVLSVAKWLEGEA